MILQRSHAGLAAERQQTIPPVERVASYAIDVTLDVETKTLMAQETISYTNITDEPIPDLTFHLYLNAFRDTNSYFLSSQNTLHRGFGWDEAHPGFIEVNQIRLQDGTELILEHLADDTLARAELPTPILPGETGTVTIDFFAQLPKVFARTGFAGDFFLVGQWFPKLGVWQNGNWNAYPFRSTHEFYADFGTYDVAIHLPDHYAVGATGLLVEEKDNGNGTQTLRYHADPVIDFAWTASPDFLESNRQINGIDVRYLFLPEHTWSVARALNAAEAALTHFGETFGPYPYAQLTIVDVPDDGAGAGGMEYPTFVTAGTLDVTGMALSKWGVDRTLEAIVIHEIGHQWFQSMVATNEVEEPWLDEGFTDYATNIVLAETYGIDRSIIDTAFLRMGYLDLRRAEYLSSPEVSMYGAASSFQDGNYSVATYAKPALSLWTLENVLSQNVMHKVMRTYFQRYQFKHPTTSDFRAVAEEVSGQNLDWFFEGMVYGKAVLNYAVTDVTANSITVVRQGNLQIPTEILVTFDDGSTLIQVWDGVEEEATFTYSDWAPVIGAELDPQRKLLLDMRWADNGLTREPDRSSWLTILGRFLYRFQDALLLSGGL